MAELTAASLLVEDLDLYPRHNVDDTHISDLVRALASGVELPPIIVDRKSKRIVDGVHRTRAWVKFLGENAVVPVEWRDYESDAAFFLEAARLNAQHGRKLDRHDQTRIVLRLRELKVDDQTIASTLHVPEPEVRTLAVRIVYDSAGTALPMKRGLEHLKGQTLSDEQVKAMQSVRSADVGRVCLELIRLLDHDLVDYTDAVLKDRLLQLGKIITATLKRIRLAS